MYMGYLLITIVLLRCHCKSYSFFKTHISNAENTLVTSEQHHHTDVSLFYLPNNSKQPPTAPHNSFLLLSLPQAPPTAVSHND